MSTLSRQVPLTPQRILRRARALLSRPGVARSGAYASFMGQSMGARRSCPTGPEDERATCFCLVGALARVTGCTIAQVEVTHTPVMHAVVDALFDQAHAMNLPRAAHWLTDTWDETFDLDPQVAFAWLARAQHALETT